MEHGPQPPSKLLQATWKKRFHNHNQTNPKPQPKPETKPKKQPEKTLAHTKQTNNNQKENSKYCH
jgi:hypothetical protein